MDRQPVGGLDGARGGGGIDGELKDLNGKGVHRVRNLLTLKISKSFARPRPGDIAHSVFKRFISVLNVTQTFFESHRSLFAIAFIQVQHRALSNVVRRLQIKL
jgi:hypothetical protein